MTKKKANSQPKDEPKAKTVSKVNSDLRLDELKTKLRKKYHLLRGEQLDYDDKDELLDRVCTILGMYRNELDVVLQDL